MGTITRPNDYSPQTTIVSSQVDNDFNTIYNEFNGNIDNSNVKSAAAIVETKIAFNTSTGHTHNGIDSKIIPQDGWVVSNDTWTYASATTFTIAGVDRTSIFTKGTKLKFTNSGQKYAVVASSSFSTNTTVTIFETTDYVIDNAAITVPYYSYAANPPGYPGWFNYVPVLTGFSANPTGGTKKFSVNGNTCSVIFTGAAFGTSNSTSLTITLPVAPAISLDFGGTVWVNDNATLKAGYIQITASTTTQSIFTSFFQVGFVASGNKNLYIPVTSFEF